MSEPNTITATLRAARAQIADPARWTQGAMARNRTGTAVHPMNSDACTWCSAGVIWYVCQRGPDPEVDSLYPTNRQALNLLTRAAGQGISLSDFNDDPTTTHADVLALFDRAIAVSEAAP